MADNSYLQSIQDNFTSLGQKLGVDLQPVQDIDDRLTIQNNISLIYQSIGIDPLVDISIMPDDDYYFSYLSLLFNQISYIRGVDIPYPQVGSMPELPASGYLG